MFTFKAFVASAERANIDPELEHEERAVLYEYKSKLSQQNNSLPDPLGIKTGWIGENNGITKWPSLIYKDIADHLSLLGPDFISRLEREYKLGKSYRYFAGEFVREIFFHAIDDTSPFCFVRCRVAPSQRTSSKPYQVWACLRKDTADNPGGQILSTYCTCTAGLKGTCNHVVGMLFRIENAVTTGMTKPSQTSRLCKWNVPTGSKVNVEPCEVSKMVFTQSHYTNVSDRNRKFEKQEYLLFSTTLHENHVKEIEDENGFRKKFYNEIKDAISTSRLSELMESKPLNRPERELYDLPETLIEKAESFVCDNSISIKENVTVFTKSLEMTDKQINDVKKVTSKQNINTEWGHYRSGRLTASNFHKIFTKVETLKKQPDKDAEALINTITGSAKRVQTKGMKHGIALEPHAKRKYCYLMTKSRSHVNLKVNEIGIVIDKTYPFIGVSPDMEITCTCCGTGIGEIKCPYSVRDQIPTHDNLPYLNLVDI